MGNVSSVSKSKKDNCKLKKDHKIKTFKSEHNLFIARYAAFQAIDNTICQNELELWNALDYTNKFWLDLDNGTFDFHNIEINAKDEDTKHKCKEVSKQIYKLSFSLYENLRVRITHALDSFVPESKVERFKQLKNFLNDLSVENLLYDQCEQYKSEWYVCPEPDHNPFRVKERELNDTLNEWPNSEENVKRADDVKILWYELAYMWLQMANICGDCYNSWYEELSVKNDGLSILRHVERLKKI